uniref:Uncharacterized protein n=1 Tax=Myotis myotis TaxID=51298 RepID=A0A7J7XHG7_MYOMY|nr:hypothetical protein mMyoMyo1_011699 [Myotis myotis]
MVMVQEKGNQLLYQAAFPDEKVLITQAPALQLRSRGMHAEQYYATIQGHSHSRREGNSANSGSLVAEQQNLPQINMAVVINREFLDKLLLFQSKEPQTLVQNVNVDEQESWQEPGEQRTVVLQARCISLIWQSFGIQVKSTELVLENNDSNTHETAPRDNRRGPSWNWQVATSYYMAVGYETDTCYRIIYVSFNTEILRNSSKPTKKKEDRPSAEQTGDPDIHISGADRYGLDLGFLGQDKFIYLGNIIFINLDMWINYESQEMVANPHSTSINDQLGQVKYIFSDKTGTLTSAHHDLKKCCINATVYCPDEDEALF